jgi:hypothetical protein
MAQGDCGDLPNHPVDRRQAVETARIVMNALCQAD